MTGALSASVEKLLSDGKRRVCDYGGTSTETPLHSLKTCGLSRRTVCPHIFGSILWLRHSDEAGIQSTRYGAFTDLTYRASQRWIFGARYDYVQSPRGPRVDQWQITPTLTWWESEFVYLRLEGQHNHQDGFADENRLLLQAVFAMGPHKHETY